MSCPNFKPMLYGLPLIVGAIDSEDAAQDYWDFEDAQLYAKEFSENLMFHNVEVCSGYYCGFQFYVQEKYHDMFDLSKDSEYCIDNDDAHYYFDMCRSAAIRKADVEKRKISAWLNSMAEGCNYEKMVLVAMFSNGEAIYERA